MTSINPSPLERAASVGTLLTNSPKRAPGALAPCGIIKGAQGPRIQLGNGLTRTKQKTDLYADDAKLCSTVSCIEGRPSAGGELRRNWEARNAPQTPGRAARTTQVVSELDHQGF